HLTLGLLVAPTVDLALDRFGDITAHELTQLAVDRLDQLRARALDDRRKACAELLAQSRVGEKIETLQNLHPDLFGERVPLAASGGEHRCVDDRRRRRRGLRRTLLLRRNLEDEIV